MWVVMVHNGGGSMVEAADHEWAATFKNQKEAEKFENALDAALRRMGYPYDSEWWTRCFELHDIGRQKVPRGSAADVAKLEAQMGRPLKKSEAAFDLDALVEMLAEGDEIELLPEPPKPVSKEEEQAAIDSILKGLT